MSYENYFDSCNLPIGYPRDLEVLFPVLNVVGYTSAVNTVSQWAGYTVSALAYGIWVSRIAGTVRIAANIFDLCTYDRNESDWSQRRNSCIGQLLRGAAEIAGLAPALIVADVIATLFLYCRWDANANANANSGPPLFSANVSLT